MNREKKIIVHLFVLLLFNSLHCSQSFSSIFGDRIVAERSDILNIKFQYSISSADVTESLVTTGSTAVADSMAVLSTGVSSTGSATITSNRAVTYEAGHETDVYFTALYTSGVANSEQFVGIFDDDNGFAVGFSGTTFGINFKRDTVDTFIAQSSFNLDPLDGTGTSGFTLVPTNLNLFRISFGWLGASPILFQILSDDGVWISFHRIERPNLFTAPSVLQPSLPMRAVVTNTGNTSDISLSTGGWNAASVTLPSIAGDRFFVASNTVTGLTTAETHVLTIRNKTTYQSEPNKVEICITQIIGESVVTFTNPLRVNIYKGATVTGLVFTDVNTANSVVEFSTVGTYMIGTGDLVYVEANSRQEGAESRFIPKNNITITLDPGQMLTMTAFGLTGTANSIFGAFSWQEQF